MTLTTVPKPQDIQWLAQGARRVFPRGVMHSKGRQTWGCLLVSTQLTVRPERWRAQQAKVLATKPGEPSLIAGLPNNRR